MEDLKLLGQIALVVIIFLPIVYIILVNPMKKVDKKYEDNNKKTNAYLDTVFNRINTASSIEALILLNDEMGKSVDKYPYTRRTYERFKVLQGYLGGRVQGLSKGKKYTKIVY